MSSRFSRIMSILLHAPNGLFVCIFYNMIIVFVYYRRCVLATKYSTLGAGGVIISTTVAICSKSRKPATVTVTVSTRTCPSTVKGKSMRCITIYTVDCRGLDAHNNTLSIPVNNQKKNNLFIFIIPRAVTYLLQYSSETW